MQGTSGTALTTVTNRALLAFSANEPPTVGETSRAAQ